MKWKEKGMVRWAPDCGSGDLINCFTFKSSAYFGTMWRPTLCLAPAFWELGCTVPAFTELPVKLRRQVLAGLVQGAVTVHCRGFGWSMLSAWNASWTQMYCPRGLRNKGEKQVVHLGFVRISWLFWTPGEYYWKLWGDEGCSFFLGNSCRLSVSWWQQVTKRSWRQGLSYMWSHDWRGIQAQWHSGFASSAPSWGVYFLSPCCAVHRILIRVVLVTWGVDSMHVQVVVCGALTMGFYSNNNSLKGGR